MGEPGDHEQDADLDDRQIEQVMEEAYGLLKEVEADSVLSSIERDCGFRSRLTLDDAGAHPPIAPPGIERGTQVPRGDRRFRVVGEMACGDVATVFRARDRDLGRHVALKILRPEHASDDQTLKRFLEEAQLGGQLQHPAIVPVYGLGVVEDDRPCIAMRLAKGETLTALLEARPDPTAERHRFLRIFEQACHAMAYAHARGVVHGDLTSAHVMVGSFGDVQIIAWGHASVIGRGAADERTDVVALGVILREILAGAQDVEECLVELVRECLDRRPRDAGVVARAVAEHLAGAEERARQAELDAVEERAAAELQRDRERRELQSAAWERRARRRTMVVAALVVATVLLGGLGYLAKERTDRQRAARTRADVVEVMRQAEDYAREEDWPRATAWARQATELAEDKSVDGATRARTANVRARVEGQAQAASSAARQAQDDAAMLARLDRIRLDAKPDEVHDRYGAAFREYGVDVETLPVDEAADRLRRSAVAIELAGALDDWAWSVRPRGVDVRLRGDVWKRLVEIARAVDPDPRRDGFRDLVFRQRSAELRRFAGTADVERLPTATLATLARFLRLSERHRDVVTLLRRAHPHHAGDFHVNYELGFSLLRRGKADEAAGYLRAALSVRPDHAGARKLLEEAGNR